jgi:tetratricopeptide (TPR) repeat protein
MQYLKIFNAILIFMLSSCFEKNTNEMLKMAHQCINEADNYYNKVDDSLKISKYKESIVLLNEVLKNQPLNYDAFFYRAYCKNNIGLTLESISEFKHLLNTNYNNKKIVYKQLGYCYLTLKDYNRTIEYYSLAIRIDSSEYISFTNRAFAKLMRFPPDSLGACNDYIKAIELGDQWNKEWVANNCK